MYFKLSNMPEIFFNILGRYVKNNPLVGNLVSLFGDHMSKEIKMKKDYILLVKRRRKVEKLVKCAILISFIKQRQKSLATLAPLRTRCNPTKRCSKLPRQYQ